MFDKTICELRYAQRQLLALFDHSDLSDALEDNLNRAVDAVKRAEVQLLNLSEDYIQDHQQAKHQGR